MPETAPSTTTDLLDEVAEKARLSPEQDRDLGLIRAHNGYGWFWVAPGGPFDRACSATTAAAMARGDVPPEYRP